MSVAPDPEPVQPQLLGACSRVFGLRLQEDLARRRTPMLQQFYPSGHQGERKETTGL